MSAGAINGTFASFAYPSNAVSMSLSNTTTSEIVRVTGVILQQIKPTFSGSRHHQLVAGGE